MMPVGGPGGCTRRCTSVAVRLGLATSGWFGRLLIAESAVARDAAWIRERFWMNSRSTFVLTVGIVGRATDGVVACEPVVGPVAPVEATRPMVQRASEVRRTWRGLGMMSPTGEMISSPKNARPGTFMIAVR